MAVLPTSDNDGCPPGRFRRASRTVLGGFAVAILILAPGCASTGAGGRSSIDAIHLLTIPVAVNLDGAPGADGIAIKVYGSLANQPKPVPIQRGSLEILMFDGLIGTGEMGETNALRTWNFNSPALRDRQYRTSIGVGYQFALTWGDAKPTQERVTILVRYRAPDGRVISSSPSPIVANVQ